MSVIKGKTESGFEYEIDSIVVDDMEFIDMLVESMDDNPLAFSVLCTKLLGADQKKALYNHLRTDGRVPIESVSAAIADIFKAFGDTGKNF